MKLLLTILLTVALATPAAYAGYGFGDESCFYYGTSEPVCFVDGEAPHAYAEGPGETGGEGGDPNAMGYWAELQFWLLILWLY